MLTLLATVSSAEQRTLLKLKSSALSYLPPDGNCIHMVDTGIVQKLLELLDRHVEDGNVTVQHAALSALRNLAIPGEPPPPHHADVAGELCIHPHVSRGSSAVVNKAKMLSAGVADVVLKFLRSEMPPVQFKLLGTLRMLIDTQGQGRAVIA